MTDELKPNVLAFAPKSREALAVQFELRLNRRTFDLEIGIVTATGDVVPLCTYPKPLGVDLGEFVDAWDWQYGEPPELAS